MRYDLKALPIADLFAPVAEASAVLARLDERIERSGFGDGFAERLHFLDACASLYLDGELVHLEDLVLHDAEADVRAPTHELTIAHAVLRTRRRIAGQPPRWALGLDGLRALKGSETTARPEPAAPVMAERADDDGDALSRELAALDAVLARSDAVLSGLVEASTTPREKDPLIYEPDWNEEERLDRWHRLAEETLDLPPVLRAAVLLDSWNLFAVLQHAPWLGRLLAAASLREAGLTTGRHLAAISLGLRGIRREERIHPQRSRRLVALVGGITRAAEAGLRDLDRLSLARQGMERKLEGRRSSSHLPELIDLVFRRPLLSAKMISEALDVSPRAAVRLVEELGLREVTGRGRFRAWGLL